MSNLIPWEELREGMDVHEEWVCGTGTIPAHIIGKIDTDHLNVQYEYGYKSWSQTTKRNREYRYWDSKPTSEEREFTPWR